ncbi:kinase-like domain-containing protein [Xylaria bambusicola]|uniref:kinase-like domain-containing protein n=1 Tax=Xylaria bambusicola TaxID=326684 RepID=UPI0020081CFA|nr:kinase-like domain-containing protein [Xylaria bambusicola]KAI0515371.1 kinase-like domain-containing protein [Xylaria bambusicola]
METPDRLSRRSLPFAGYVKENSLLGKNGRDEESSYISREKLTEYWDGDKILRLLGPNDKQVNIHTISTTHLQVFSILVWISERHHNWIDYILYFISANFNDSQLPLAPPQKPGEQSPYDTKSCPFPSSPDGLHAWRQFSEEQWRFVPLQLRSHDGTQIERVTNGVDVRQIRPITVDEQLHPESFNSAKIYKVLPHESSGLPVDHPIILKEYPVDELEGQFKQEHTVYTYISNNMHDSPDDRDAHFLRYYGAFLQGDKCVLLLEYCSEGTLLDLFQDCWYLPRTEEEARVLWAAALHLLEGLDFLHSKGGNSLVIHQDIKPANIFVFKDIQPGKPDGLLFKLGDFGMSSTSDPSARGEAEGPDNQGSRIYSSPEIPAWTERDQNISRTTSWHSDIWSFGCVLYELALWMATFERGRIEFREARIEATKQTPRIAAAGYRGAFHDGKVLLPIVKAKVEELSSLGTPVASLSRELMQFFLDHMLQPNPGKRLYARQLKLYLIDRLDKITPSVSATTSIPNILSDSPQLMASPPPLISSPTTPNSRHRLPLTPSRTSAVELQGSSHISSYQSPMTSPGSTYETDLRLSRNWSPNAAGGQSYSPRSPPVSYPTIPPASMLTSTQHMITNHENNNDASRPARKYRPSNYPLCTVEEVIRQGWPQKSKKKRDESKLPGLSQAVRDLKDRDQCFIIDNSSSMTNCWEKVISTTMALASIAQDIDPDNIEFHCTNTNNPLKTKGCKGLEQWLKDNQPYNDIGSCRMENHLDRILPDLVTKATKQRNTWDRVLKKQRAKGINVYVLTNGVWENRDSETVDAAKQSIQAIVNKVKEHGPTFLSIQFVRFGEHPVGKRRLQWLDDELKYHIPDQWDIVDTTPHTGSVWKMLIGATSEWEDNIEEEMEQADPFIS